MLDKIFPDGGPLSSSAAGQAGAVIAVIVIVSLIWCRVVPPGRQDHSKRRGR
jgi:hypothetical protein